MVSLNSDGVPLSLYLPVLSLLPVDMQHLIGAYDKKSEYDHIDRGREKRSGSGRVLEECFTNYEWEKKDRR